MCAPSGGWSVQIDARAGGEWVRVRLLAPPGSAAGASDTAHARAALEVAGALLEALGARDTAIADAAELLADVRQEVDGAAEQLAHLGHMAEQGEPEACAAAGLVLDAGEAAELLDAASAGEPDALEQLAQITAAADDGDAEAVDAERHLCTPALLGFPTLDLGSIVLGREPARAAALRRLRAALAPMEPAARLATATIRAIGRLTP